MSWLGGWRYTMRRITMKGIRIFLVVVAALFLVGSASAQSNSDGADRLYVLYCGSGHSVDGSNWTPGIDVGKPKEISNNCYLIHDGAHGYFLWDTGISDYVASM